MGEHVTDYVAERLLERERMIEGDWLSLSHMMDARNADVEKLEATKEVVSQPALSESMDESQSIQSVVNKPQHSTLSLFVWFLTGLIAGAGILFILAWVGLMEQIVQWV